MSFKIIIDNKCTDLPNSIRQELITKYYLDKDLIPKIVFTDVIFEGTYDNKLPELIEQLNFVPNLLDEQILECELSKNYLDNTDTEYCPELFSAEYIETEDVDQKLAGSVFYQIFRDEDYLKKFLLIRLAILDLDLDKSELLGNFSSFKKYFVNHLLESHYNSFHKIIGL